MLTQLKAIIRDLAYRAEGWRIEQATVPPSRYNMALRTNRRNAVEMQRLARRLHGQGWDARFPG